MADLDPYVKAIQDLLGQIGSPADRMRAIEQAVVHLWQPEQAARAAQDVAGALSALPGHVVELQKLLSQFAAPGAQLHAFQEQLALTRQQLELVASQLESAEKVVERFAALADQLAGLQEPFAKIANRLVGAS